MIKNDKLIGYISDIYTVVYNCDVEAARVLAEDINANMTSEDDPDCSIVSSINGAGESAGRESEEAVCVLLSGISMIEGGVLKANIIKVRNKIRNNELSDEEVRAYIDGLGDLSGSDHDMRSYIIWLMKAASMSNMKENIPYIREKLLSMQVI